MKSNLYESIRKTITEGTTYKCAPSYNETDGFYSMTNTEAFEAAKDVAKYFADYSEFLNSDEGLMYIDKNLAPLFKEFADSVNEYCNKIETEWEKM